MNVVRNEIRTGLLVVVTLAALILVLFYLASPGVFRHTRLYNIYFDDAGGIQAGAAVMLSGRKVGQVKRLTSPVPPEQRPRPDLEAIVQVEVNEGTPIYREVRVIMLQYSMLGEQVIDFTAGKPASGLAPEDTKFIGERQVGINDAAPKILQKLDPVVKSALQTMAELQKTAAQISAITAQGSDLNRALANFKGVGENLVELSGTGGSIRRTLGHLENLTDEESPLTRALQNAETFTRNLATNKDIDRSFRNFRQASANLNTTVQGLNGTVRGIRPRLNATLHNAEQFTDTVKRQPWRLVWPTTKKYPEDQRPAGLLAKPAPTPTPTCSPAPAPPRVAEKRKRQPPSTIPLSDEKSLEIPRRLPPEHDLNYYLNGER